mmetsp:Transcript_96592/g.273074  ORF Transcript_96592/g.273074 Transcript_96592/m.273074 type:complete len:220 (-) Transcript_96592:174-833(-)
MILHGRARAVGRLLQRSTKLVQVHLVVVVFVKHEEYGLQLCSGQVGCKRQDQCLDLGSRQRVALIHIHPVEKVCGLEAVSLDRACNSGNNSRGGFLHQLLAMERHDRRRTSWIGTIMMNWMAHRRGQAHGLFHLSQVDLPIAGRVVALEGPPEGARRQRGETLILCAEVDAIRELVPCDEARPVRVENNVEGLLDCEAALLEILRNLGKHLILTGCLCL